MQFKSFTKKYNFSDNALLKHFPDYMRRPIANWLWLTLSSSGQAQTHISNNSVRWVNDDLLDNLQIFFREVFPRDWNSFISFIFANSNRTADFISFCLQNFSDSYRAVQLELIFSQGGSAYEVIRTKKDTFEGDKGNFDLAERVSKIVKEQAIKAISENDLLSEAWNAYYSRNPDYEKVVSRCCDFLENFLGKVYYPQDSKPQLRKFIHFFESNPSILTYKGSSIVDPKSNLTSLLKEATNIRGQHTAGKGRKPEKEEAEFVLHTTVYIWNLHQK